MALRRLALALSLLVLGCWRPLFAQYSSSTNQGIVDTTQTTCNTASQNQNCWIPVVGAPALSQIAVGADGYMIGIKTDNTLTQYNPVAKTWSALPLPSLAVVKQVAAGDSNTVYSVADTHIFKLTNGAWTRMSSSLSFGQVSVGEDGDMWALGTAAYGCGNTVYHYNASTGSFVLQTQGLSQISVASASNVYGICISIAYPNDNMFHYDGTAWSGYHGWLAQVAAGADALWGFNRYQTYHKSSGAASWDGISGLPSFIASSRMLATYGIFSNQLEQYQSYVLSVSHTVSGQYSGPCPFTGAYAPLECSQLMHTAVSYVQISGHAQVQQSYAGVYNTYLSATASDALTPLETSNCVQNNACPSFTTGGPSNTGAGVTCPAMGLMFQDLGIGYFFAIAETLVRNLSGAAGYNCRKVSIWGTINCDFNTIQVCTNSTPYSGPSVVTDSPPGLGGWWSTGECVREGPSYPWICGPLPYAALKTTQTGPANCPLY